jgi:hypothetical protein
MGRLKLVVAATIAAIALLAGATPASAWLHPGSTTQYPPEGGRWTYGFWDIKVRSYYYHGSRCHGSTADFWNGSEWRRHRSLNTRAGVRSVAEIGGYNTWYTDDRYWYRVGC